MAFEVLSLATMLSAVSLEPVWKWRVVELAPPMSIVTCLDFSDETDCTSLVCHFWTGVFGRSVTFKIFDSK